MINSENVPLDFRDHFYQFGEISNIHVVPKQKCAFVTFSTRPAAEKAADGSFNKVIIKGAVCSTGWW